MNKTTRKQISTEAQDDRFCGQEPRAVMSCEGLSHRRRANCVSGQGRVRSLILTDAISGRQSMTVVEEEDN